MSNARDRDVAAEPESSAEGTGASTGVTGQLTERTRDRSRSIGCSGSIDLAVSAR